MYAVLYKKEKVNNSLNHYRVVKLVEGNFLNDKYHFKIKGEDKVVPMADFYDEKEELNECIAFPIAKEDLEEKMVDFYKNQYMLIAQPEIEIVEEQSDFDEDDEEYDMIDNEEDYFLIANQFAFLNSNVYSGDGTDEMSYYLYNDYTDEIIEVDVMNNFVDIILKPQKEKNANESEVIASFTIVNEENLEEEIEEKPEIPFSELYENMNKRIICQDKQIKQIITAIKSNLLFDDPKLKSNILVAGPTGVGKTEIFRAISELMNIPIYIADSNEFTVAGYVGGDVEDAIHGLFVNANYDIEKAEKGIIVFDEIDKLASTSDKEGISTVGVLNSLLKMMEGKEINLKKGYKNIKINTSKMTFVALGAFSKIEDINHKKNGIGFNTEISQSEDKYEINSDTLTKYGMPREFIGRFNTIVQMNNLEKEDLKNILLNSSESPLLKYQKEAEKLNIDFKFDETTIDYIVEEAYKTKTGARSLAKITKELFEEKLFDYFNTPEDFKGIDLTKQKKLIK